MKEDLSDLCVLGGKPLFLKKLHVGQPNIRNRENLLNRFNDILDNRWFTNNGPYVQEFEKRIEEFIGIKHCIAMCNGTIALEIAIRALEIEGDVIIPSCTFIATAHALQWQKITPVFCDIDPETHNIDPNQVENIITPRTSGIIGVHLWGRPCDIESLTRIAKKNKLKLLFDSAHAFACDYRGKMIGNFGDAEIFSFHATKFVNTFEGGAVVTNDDNLAKKIRLMRNFGFEGYDNVVYIGTNGKMSEVSAAMGLTSLDSLEYYIEVNYKNYKQYAERLNDIPGISVVTYDEKQRNNYQYIIIEIDDNHTILSRDQMIHILHAENILARRYFYPGCHKMEPYRSLFPHSNIFLQNSENILSKVISLPTGTTITVEDINMICELLRYIINNANKIKKRLLW